MKKFNKKNKCLILRIVRYLKKQDHKKKFKQAGIGILKDFRSVLPLFFLAVLIASFAEVNVPDYVILGILGNNIYLSIFIATVAGILLPFPKYASYPLAALLYAKGAFIGSIFAFIAGEVFIGNLFEDYLEVKYFGWRFFWFRLFASFVFVFLAALIVQVII